MSSPSARWVLWGLLAAGCLLQGVEVWTRGIDPDELEHLHAAYCVSRGMVPYRDFFEHHGPLLYYAAQPLFWLFGPELNVLWAARFVMWGFSLATLGLTAAIAKRISTGLPGTSNGDGPHPGPLPGGEGEAGASPLVAATLLVWSTIFHAKGIELRPDVPATLLLTAAFWLSLPKREATQTVTPPVARVSGPCERRPTLVLWLVIGLLCGLATLFTQKSIIPVAGLVLASVVQGFITGQRSRLLLIPLLTALGGAVVWGGAFGIFALAGAADDLWQSAVVRLHTWPVRSQTWNHLRPTLLGDLTLWISAALAIVGVLRRWRKRALWSTGRGQVALAALCSIAALFGVKATYPQYYLLWFPLLAALAGIQLVELASRFQPNDHPTRAATWLPIGAALLALAQLLLFWRAVRLGTSGALPRLSQLSPEVLLLGGFIPLALAAALLPARRLPAALSVGLVAALASWYGILRNVDFALWSRAPQVAMVETLHAHVTQDETVLDGFTGYGALRPHAYYYWWLNEYSLPLLTPDEQGSALLAQLQKAPPAAILFDRDLQRLPAVVTDWIRAHYRPTDVPPLWLRAR